VISIYIYTRGVGPEANLVSEAIMTESPFEKQKHPTHPPLAHKPSNPASYWESVKRVIMILSVLSLATLALSSLALPAPVPPPGVRKVTTIPAFNVTGFTASAVVLSHRV
jgi:hypothetical protein